MNRIKFREAYDAMTPDEAARQRMLKRIMEQGGQNVKKEYSAQPQKSKGWLGPLAAVLVLAVLTAGVVTMLNREVPSQLNSDQTSGTTEGTVETKNETIQDFKISLFYWTAMEYADWINSDAVSNQWQKQAEIAEHFGMKAYNGDDRGTDSYDFFLEEVGLTSFLREDVAGVIWDIESCWYYDQERFNVAGSVTMAWEDSPRTVPVDFNFYRTAPDYLFPVLSEMGSLENYEYWEYTLSSGDTAILARNQEIAYVIVYRTEEVYFVVVDNWRQSESDRAMTREALEAFAELFRYEMIDRVPLESTDIEVEITQAISAYPYSDIEDLANCTVAVSLQPVDVWQEASGTVFMNVTIYCYDLYDLVDISKLEVGDYISIRWQPVEIISLDRAENGDVLINSGLGTGGYTLRTDEDGVYYEVANGGAKYWQEYTSTTIAVSPDFQFSDLRESCGLVYTLETFQETEFVGDFTPYNTTLVIENGVAVAMERVYAP